MAETEVKGKEVEAIQEKQTRTNKTYWLITIDGDYYSAWEIPEGLQAGDVINYSWIQKGDFRNIKSIEIVEKIQARIEKKQKPEEKVEKVEEVEVEEEIFPGGKQASEINDIDERIREGSGIMLKCMDALKQMFEVEKLEEEHIILLNSLFNYVMRPRPMFIKGED